MVIMVIMSQPPKCHSAKMSGAKMWVCKNFGMWYEKSFLLGVFHFSILAPSSVQFSVHIGPHPLPSSRLWHMMSCRAAKMLCCQNVVLPNCHVAKVLWCQNDCCLKVVLPKCRSAEMWRVPKCRSVEMSWCQRKKKCRNVVLPKCRAAKMLCYQSVFCQNVVLPICPLPGCRAAQVVVMPKCVLPNCRVFQIVRCREVGEPLKMVGWWTLPAGLRPCSGGWWQ